MAKSSFFSRFGLYLLLLLTSVTTRYYFSNITPIFLLFGIFFAQIWFTLGNSIDQMVVTINHFTPTAQAPSTNTTTTTTAAPAGYNKLTFTKAADAQLVGKTTYILNHPLSIVSYSIFNKFPIIPCEEMPELISITLVDEEQISDTIVQKTRLITSANIVPAYIGSAMGLAATTMVLESSEEILNESLTFIVENQDAVDLAVLQVYETFKQLPDGTTQATAETWLATPGLNYFIAKGVRGFASTMYNQKSPQNKAILIARCQDVADTREHETNTDNTTLNNNNNVETTNVVPETPSRPA